MRSSSTVRTLWLVALLATAVEPRRASGAVDMTGDWYAAVGNFGPVMLVHFTQTAGVLATDNGGTGTVDSTTGAFTLTFPPTPPQCGATFEGQVAPGGAIFGATGNVFFTPPDCHSILCACSGSDPAELRGSRSPCGNGTVDPGEECDDGNLGRNGDCCALGCTVQPDGTSCADGLFCNGDETTCQGGVCQAGTPPCPTACDEASDACITACPPTPQICRAAAKSRLLVKKSIDDTKDKLIWKWTQGAATSQMEFADPTSGADYALCIYAAMSPPLIGQAIVPADPAKWRSVGAIGFKYKDATASAGGIYKILLRGSAQNKAKVQVRGTGSALEDLPLPVTAPVSVQLVNGSTGTCWGASYSDLQLQRNEGAQLKAKAP